MVVRGVSSFHPVSSLAFADNCFVPSYSCCGRMKSQSCFMLWNNPYVYREYILLSLVNKEQTDRKYGWDSQPANAGRKKGRVGEL